MNNEYFRRIVEHLRYEKGFESFNKHPNFDFFSALIVEDSKIGVKKNGLELLVYQLKDIDNRGVFECLEIINKKNNQSLTYSRKLNQKYSEEELKEILEYISKNL